MLLSPKNRGKWNKQQRICKGRYAELLKEDSERNCWPMAKIVAINSDTTENVFSGFFSAEEDILN